MKQVKTMDEICAQQLQSNSPLAESDLHQLQETTISISYYSPAKSVFLAARRRLAQQMLSTQTADIHPHHDHIQYIIAETYK